MQTLRRDPDIADQMRRDLSYWLCRCCERGYIGHETKEELRDAKEDMLEFLLDQMLDNGWTKMPDIDDNPKFMGAAGDPAEGKAEWGASNPSMADVINAFAAECHRRSSSAGWWQDPDNPGHDLEESPYFKYVVGTKLMLCVSEVCEGMEGHRKGKMDDHLPHRPMIEVEIADAMIRLGDLAKKLRLDVGGAIVEKWAYNDQRPDHKPGNRQMAGGKSY